MSYIPKLEDRAAINYAGIRTQVPISAFGDVIPQRHGEVFGWLEQHGIAPAGAPFIRYHVIDMQALMDVEMGVPVAEPIEGDEHVSAGVMPAGRYAALVYTGIDNGVAANGALLDWGAQQGLVWDERQVEAGDAFGGRYESFLTDPADEPDMAKWQTEVAIRLADEQS